MSPATGDSRLRVVGWVYLDVGYNSPLATR